MITLPMTLDLPEAIYNQLKDRAAQTQRSIEEEALDVLTDGIASEGELTPELLTAIAEVEALDDASLREIATATLAREISGEIEDLHQRRADAELSPEESQRLEELMEEYQKHMLRKAKAAAILRTRTATQIDNGSS